MAELGSHELAVELGESVSALGQSKALNSRGYSRSKSQQAAVIEPFCAAREITPSVPTFRSRVPKRYLGITRHP